MSRDTGTTTSPRDLSRSAIDGTMESEDVGEEDDIKGLYAKSRSSMSIMLSTNLNVSKIKKSMLRVGVMAWYGA